VPVLPIEGLVGVTGFEPATPASRGVPNGWPAHRSGALRRYSLSSFAAHPMSPLMMEVTAPSPDGRNGRRCALPQFFPPGFAIPRERCAPKTASRPVLLCVGALRVRRRQAGFETSIEAGDWRG